MAFPVDTHVAQRLREWYPACARLKPVQMRAWAQNHFGPDAGYATLVLTTTCSTIADSQVAGRFSSQRHRVAVHNT